MSFSRCFFNVARLIFSGLMRDKVGLRQLVEKGGIKSCAGGPREIPFHAIVNAVRRQRPG